MGFPFVVEPTDAGAQVTIKVGLFTRTFDIPLAEVRLLHSIATSVLNARRG